MTAQENDYWTIKSPDGYIYPSPLRRTRAVCIIDFTCNWKKLYKQGYRCIKIQLKEL